MKIVISGAAKATDRETGELVTDPHRLSKLNGLIYAEDSCVEYLSESLYQIGIIGGQIELRFDANFPKLQVVTTFHATRKLKRGELQLLTDETIGQWGDGIGEGEFQFAEDLGIEVDVSPFESKPIVEQVNDDVEVRKPKKNELIELLQKRKVDESAAIELVRLGGDIEAKDRYGLTVLELACRAVLPNLVGHLLKRGALAKAKEPGRTLSALSFCYGSDAVLQNSVQVARLLLDEGVNVDGVDESGRTPLMMAVNRNNLPLVKFLLSRGANVNAQDKDEANQLTVLMYASDMEVLEYLLEHDADPSICSAYGKNAYEVRLANSHQENYEQLAQMLKRYLDAK